MSNSPPTLLLLLLSLTERTSRNPAQRRKVLAVSRPLRNHIARIIDVALDQTLELRRRRVPREIPEIRYLPIDRDAGGVGHARTGLPLRGPAWVLAFGPGTLEAVWDGAEVGEAADGEVVHAGACGFQVEVLRDVVEVLGGGVEEFGDEGVGGVVAWEENEG